MCTGLKKISGKARRGFTLIELLVALVVMALAFTIVWSAFSSVTKAWRRGGQVVDDIRHGDFVVDQLVSALRSTAYFPLKPERYGFWYEDSGDKDEISWVTSGTSFMPPDSPLAQGVHRLMVSIESNDDGKDSFTVRAFPHLAEEMEKNDVPAWHISQRVKGLDVQIWNPEDEKWEDEWEDTNKIPGLIQVTLFMEAPGKYEPPIKISRLIQIPLGPATTSAVSSAGGQAGVEGGQNTPEGGEGGGIRDGEPPAGGGDDAAQQGGRAFGGERGPRTRIISGQ